MFVSPSWYVLDFSYHYYGVVIIVLKSDVLKTIKLFPWLVLTIYSGCNKMLKREL